MQTFTLVIVVAAGLWLAGVGLLMALRPGTCLHLFEQMTAKLHAASWRLNLAEQGLRILAGAALILRAPASKLPLLFEIAGWLLVLSSLLILAVPIRWHAAYGSWWSSRLTPPVIRLLAPLPVAAGAGLIYAAL